jgi:hypothetical protein
LYEAAPAYQLAVQSTGYRTTPDVSMVADPGTGAWIADPYNFGDSDAWTVVGGTSLSAPSWAGLFALANQGLTAAGKRTLNSDGRTAAQQGLYNVPAADFNDVTDGTNGFSAGAGYDLVTGLGTPRADRLIPDLIAYDGAVNADRTVSVTKSSLGAAGGNSAANPGGVTNLVAGGAGVANLFNAQLVAAHGTGRGQSGGPAVGSEPVGNPGQLGLPRLPDAAGLPPDGGSLPITGSTSPQAGSTAYLPPVFVLVHDGDSPVGGDDNGTALPTPVITGPNSVIAVELPPDSDEDQPELPAPADSDEWADMGWFAIDLGEGPADRM